MDSIHSGESAAADATDSTFSCAPGDAAAAIEKLIIASAIRPVVIAPTHNNARTLPAMLQRIQSLGLAMIVIDDGSTDATAGQLAEWAENAIENRVVTHRRNLGKAAALRSGFVESARAGFSHAITIDTDGQLSPEDIPRLLQVAAMDESAMILGVRDSRATDYPMRSQIGRWISNQLVRFETGRKIADSQCGLRVYPLKVVNTIRCGSGHYGFETEIITRAVWAGTPILQSPVHCRYFAGADRVSHFKPFLDSVRALRMHALLILTAMNPIHRKNAPPGSAPAHSLARQFLHWLNPVTAWRQVRHTEGARVRFAFGFAVGVFIANLPIYGLQSVLAFFVARRFRLNPVPVFAGANIAVPPINALLIACGIAVGHLILHGSWPHWQTYHPTSAGLHELLLPMLTEWLVGCWIFGLVLAGVSFVFLDLLLRLVSDPKPILLAPSPGTPGEGRGEGDFGLQTVLANSNHPHPSPLPEYRERGPETEPAK